jgi:hypothetical protein
MDFTFIAEAVAREHSTEIEWYDERKSAFFMLSGSVPIILSQSTCVDGVQWFEIVAHIGTIEERSRVPLHAFLYDNLSRHSPFALKDIDDKTWLVVKDRYAVCETVSDSDCADILHTRLCGCVGLFYSVPVFGPGSTHVLDRAIKMNRHKMPGVRFCDGELSSGTQ